MIFDLEPRSASVNPLWWRIPAWAAITAVTVVQAHGVWHRVGAGVLLGVGALVFQLMGNRRVDVRRLAIIVPVVCGHAAMYASPSGLAEILVVVAASRAPRAFEGRELRWFTVVVTVAFGLAVGDISNSLPGLLAGLGIPLLVQRALEQQIVVRERDRAQALLAEVQAGREAETQAAALRERGRIAREIHDVLAHSLAGLSVQLQAVRAVAAREQVGPAVLEPLDRAAQLARDGVAEARAAVSTLRDPVGLGLAELSALVERHPGHATLAASGPEGQLSAAAGHAVYRGVQESLTNSARYAPGSDVAVLLDWHPECLVVTVTDDGPAAGRRAVTEQGSGLGLAGMAERVGAAGGSVTSGPHGTRGWQTRLELPTAQEDA